MSIAFMQHKIITKTQWIGMDEESAFTKIYFYKVGILSLFVPKMVVRFVSTSEKYSSIVCLLKVNRVF